MQPIQADLNMQKISLVGKTNGSVLYDLISQICGIARPNLLLTYKRKGVSHKPIFIGQLTLQDSGLRNCDIIKAKDVYLNRKYYFIFNLLCDDV